MPSEDVCRVVVSVPEDLLDLSAEREAIGRSIEQVLHVTPEQMQAVREGRYQSISMGCSVSAAPCPECSWEDPPPQSIPQETRDRIIRQYLESLPGRPQVAAAAAPALARRLGPSPWHPDFGSDLRRAVNPDFQLIDISVVSEGGIPFKVVKPLPSWCQEGAVVRRWADDKDYSVILVGGSDVWFRAHDDGPNPLQVVCSKEHLAQNWQSEWRPHPLPPTKWERLLKG